MFHNFRLGHYYPIRSKIHFMNPISKLLCTMLFIGMTFFSTTIELTLCLAVLTLLLLTITNISLKNYLKIVKVLVPFYLIVLIVNIIFMVPIVDIFIMIVRFTLIFLYLAMLTLTTPFTEIIYALEKIFGFLKLFRINVSSFALTITSLLKFIPYLIDEMNRILKTQASRGVCYYNSNLKGKIYALKNMIGPAFVLTLKKINDLKQNMHMRLYNSEKKRTNFRMNRWKPFDTYMIMIHIIILLVIIKKEVLG